MVPINFRPVAKKVRNCGAVLTITVSCSEEN